MKTAISIPDPIFNEAERLARRLGKSRSELYRDALAEYVTHHSPAEITEKLDRVAAALGGEDDEFRRAAVRRTLEKIEW